ncbi:hypothetical protein EVAR_81555_1 [Eumeta japonica]|uniref:Uncharacterized protein n=1 Tax=Eumeta variegata TaxID=151549 RepID=A0A4C1UZY2_EUMVA|nr:hypothetical protein EVAR_81555_1 [Eumeta japonica]
MCTRGSVTVRRAGSGFDIRNCPTALIERRPPPPMSHPYSSDLSRVKSEYVFFNSGHFKLLLLSVATSEYAVTWIPDFGKFGFLQFGHVSDLISDRKNCL